MRYLKRSRSRERFLDRMFRARQKLKDKFNYQENHPWQSRIFRTTLIAYRINVNNPLSFRRFQRIWRKKMDGMFDLETLQYKRDLIQEKIHKEKIKRPRRSRSRPKKACDDVIARILINYDREVIAAIRVVKQEFIHYLQYPHRYIYIETEKKNFLKFADQNNNRCEDFVVDLDGADFKKYWSNRVGVLCDEKVKLEKNLIRIKWRLAVRNHLRLSKDPKVEDLQNLLKSEDEDASDVEIIEHQQSIIDISSDED